MINNKTELDILAKRLRNTIDDEKLKIKRNELLEATGCSRQTFSLYELGKREMKFSFIQKCFSFLNDKTPSHNLNIQYFVDPKCNEQYISRVSTFENLNISSQGIANIKTIKNKHGTPYLNTLNILLANNQFPEFIGNFTNLQNKAPQTQEEKDFLQWQIQKLILSFFDSVITDLTPKPKKFDQPNWDFR